MSADIDYPRFLRDLLDACPSAGEGVHPWLFRVARYLHGYHTPEEICAILEQRVADCGRNLAPHEIPDAVNNSYQCKWDPNRDNSMIGRPVEWVHKPVMRLLCIPAFEPELATKTASRVPVEITPEWLKARSPWPVDCSTTLFLKTLLEPGEKALLFNDYKSQGARLWPDEPIERWSQIHWPDGAWFLCNPVDRQEHFNPRLGRNSRRSKESVTAWLHAVLECDHEPKEKWLPIWLKILVQLPLPIVAITDSAGKSMHALIRVPCDSKEEWDRFKRVRLVPLVKFGACPGALSAVRLTRLPQCFRGDRRQELLYLNPNATGSPIFDGAVFYL